jgi:hypothetical protein
LALTIRPVTRTHKPKPRGPLAGRASHECPWALFQLCGCDDDGVQPELNRVGRGDGWSVVAVPRWKRAAPWALAGVTFAALIALGSFAYFGRGSSQTTQSVARTLISVAPADELGTSTASEGRPARAMALSSDGRWLVFSAVSGDQRQFFLHGRVCE